MAKYKRKIPTTDDVMEKAESDEHQGWCFYCGDWTHDACKPDAHHYECPECERNTVFAAEEILLQGLHRDE